MNRVTKFALVATPLLSLAIFGLLALQIDWQKVKEEEVNRFESEFNKTTITGLQWHSYGEIITQTKKIQGLITQIDKVPDNKYEFKIIFGSGSPYFLTSVGTELKVGDIITINENHIENRPCQLKFIDLSNGTTYVNDREYNFTLQNDKFKFKSGDEMYEIFYSFGHENFVQTKEQLGVIPYDPNQTCRDRTNYQLVSVDSRLVQEPPIEWMMQNKIPP